MRKLDNLLKNKIVDYNKAIKYGFIKDKEIYCYKLKICDEQFEIEVTLSDNENTSKVIDLMTDEEYILVDVEDSSGEFVGKVREEYEKVLKEIIANCTNSNVFKEEQSKDVIKYINEKYNDSLEFLWEKFDDNAIWRNKQNNKWYGLLGKIPKNKLGIDSDEVVEVIIIRYEKGKVNEIIDNKKVFPGYHMNKQSWITIILDNSMENKELFNLVDNSYNLSIGNKRKSK